jgi:hypothetical protein
MTDFKAMKEVFFEKLFNNLESKCAWYRLTPEIIISTLCETLVEGIRKNGRFSEDRKFRKFFSLCENCKDGKKLFLSLNNPNPPLNLLACYSEYFEMIKKEDFRKLPLDQQIPLSFLDLVGYLPRVKLGYLYSSFGVEDERIPVDLIKRKANSQNRKPPSGKRGLKEKEKEKLPPEHGVDPPQQSAVKPVHEESPRDKTLDDLLKVPSKIVSFPTIKPPDRLSSPKANTSNEIKRKVNEHSEVTAHRTNKRLKTEETKLLPVDKDSLWEKYFDALIGYQEQTGRFQVAEETQVESKNGKIFSLGKWLQLEKRKLDFYFENDPERYDALSNWFENELMDSTNEITNKKETEMPVSKSEKENHFTDDSQTMATVNSSLLSMAASTVTTSSSSSIPSQSIHQIQQPSEKTVTSRVGNILQVVAFEYEKDFLYYIGLGRVIKYVTKNNTKMAVLQKFIVCQPENPLKSVVEETNETVTIAEGKIFKNKSKIIQFALAVNLRGKSILPYFNNA